MTKTLITGAAGFIGSNLAKRLEQDGHDLTLVDNFSRGKKSYLDYLGVKTICRDIDLRDYMFCKIYTENVDTVYHTACRIGGEQFLHGSPKKELTALQDNLTIDTNLFRACVENKVKKIIYTSSVSVYNTVRQIEDNATFTEIDIYHDRIDPEKGYGWAKFVGEKQLEFMSKTGIKVGVSRIFKSYGPCDDYSPESGQVVLSLMRKAINYPKEPFVVWGNGRVARCFLYIDDLIDGLIKLSDYIDNHESLTVNMGAKEQTSIRDLAQKIVSLSGKDIKIEYDYAKKQSPSSRIPILDLAKENLGWKPTTSLDDGLKKTYDWMLHEKKEGGIEWRNQKSSL